VGLALDPAASEFYDSKLGKYIFRKSGGGERTREQMVDYWSGWVTKYPIISLEDGMAEGTGRAGNC
jgi:enolase